MNEEESHGTANERLKTVASGLVVLAIGVVDIWIVWWLIRHAAGVGQVVVGVLVGFLSIPLGAFSVGGMLGKHGDVALRVFGGLGALLSMLILWASLAILGFTPYILEAFGGG